MKTNLTLAVTLLGFAITSPATMAEEHQHPASIMQSNVNQSLDGYVAVSDALYKDDLAAAKKAAAGLETHVKDPVMLKSSQAIANSKTLEEARTHFKALSDVAIPIAKGDASMHVAHCPMAAGGKGASWLQKSADEVQNPYMGAKMPHCGKVAK